MFFEQINHTFKQRVGSTCLKLVFSPHLQLEELRKKWLLDRLLTYELYVPWHHVFSSTTAFVSLRCFLCSFFWGFAASMWSNSTFLCFRAVGYVWSLENISTETHHWWHQILLAMNGASQQPLLLFDFSSDGFDNKEAFGFTSQQHCCKYYNL